MPDPVLARTGTLREYLTDQLNLTGKAASAVVSALVQWVTDNPNPNPAVFAELATNATLMHAEGASLSSAVWVADWLSVNLGEAVPVPEVATLASKVDDLRDAYTVVASDVAANTRQYFTIRDRLMKADGLDKDEAGRQAMAAIRAQAEKRAARLAENVVRDAGVDGMSEAMELTGRIVGWTRELHGDNCPDCQALADGSVLPPGARMVRHPGCDCTQKPILRGHQK